VQQHPLACAFEQVKCPAFAQCKSRTAKQDLPQHRAVCPYVEVPCIYCKELVER
jgi:hypothetical protein